MVTSLYDCPLVVHADMVFCIQWQGHRETRESRCMWQQKYIDLDLNRCRLLRGICFETLNFLCVIRKAFWLRALKPSVPAVVKWSEVKPTAHLWPQFQPEPAAAPGSWKTVDGSKIAGQGWRNVGSLATLTRTTYQQPAVERRKERKTVELQCGNARSCRSGKSRAGHRSQPSTNPHHLPGFKSINSSLPFGSVLDLAEQGGSS